MKATRFEIVPDYPLASATTLGVGGPASFFAPCPDPASLARALAWAESARLPCFVLGGGSNLLVADEGFAGLAAQPTARGLEVELAGDSGRLRAEAGCPWDEVVEAAVDAGLAGIEALSGIPGSVGAAPIQNIGAYGQEIAGSLDTVEVWDRRERRLARLAAGECGFAYRQSHFKGAWRDRYVVLAVELRLRRVDTAAVAYPELARALGLAGQEMAPLPAIRSAVLGLRGAKAMLYEPDRLDGRSAGSFFLNPVVREAEADRVAAIAKARGCARELPRYPSPEGVKLSAAWLIEEAGFARGWGEGRAGLSTRHTLAIVNRGGAGAFEVLAVARAVRRGVLAAFGVGLAPEPIFLGFPADAVTVLAQSGLE